MKINIKKLNFSVTIVLLCLVFGCTGRYFHNVDDKPLLLPRYNLDEWPYKEYWTGIIFNGEKIGFTHQILSPSKESSEEFDIFSDAVLNFRFLMMDKKVNLKSYDSVHKDLTLSKFVYDYNLDGNRMRLIGTIKDGKLVIKKESQGLNSEQTIIVEDKLYPSSIMYMYPLLYGLEIGRHYEYQVFDGESQSVSTAIQDILSYQESDLFTGKAFKVRTKMQGQEIDTWINAEGMPLLEMALGGVLISGIESEIEAKKYIAQNTINKGDILIDFSLIKTEIPINDQERVRYIEIIFSGIDQGIIVIPSDERQECSCQNDKVVCRITKQRLDNDNEYTTDDIVQLNKYLRSTHTISSNNELIQKKAQEIVKDTHVALEQIRLLLDWIKNNIDKEPIDVFSALDVLLTKKAECEGHAYLYTAFARSLNIPTRVVSGIVYSRIHQGFLYHSWSESYIQGRWISVDPTFNQLPVDATHIKFVEGEDLKNLLPLVNLIGKLKARIISIEYNLDYSCL